jgi:hypothetical protein
MALLCGFIQRIQIKETFCSMLPYNLRNVELLLIKFNIGGSWQRFVSSLKISYRLTSFKGLNAVQKHFVCVCVLSKPQSPI